MQKKPQKTHGKVPALIQIIVILAIAALGVSLWLPSLIKERNSLGGVIEDSTYPTVTVHYIDVGQGDSIFVELPKHRALLIDAGTAEAGDDVVDYIDDLGYSHIDYLIGTHPHSDHIGGLPAVLNAFSVGEFYMPKVSHTTKTFENVLDAAEENGLKIRTAKAGVVLVDEELLRVELLAPVRDDYEELNDWSAACMVTYDITKFLFTGDMEETAEQDLVGDISANVLKVGHHGSDTATSEEFLERVDPDYAIISVGEGNSYGHPHEQTLDRLKEHKCEVYRTDESGTIVAYTNGQRIAFLTEK